MSKKQEILKKLENQVLLYIGTYTIAKIMNRNNDYNDLKLTERLEISIIVDKLRRNPGRCIG